MTGQACRSCCDGPSAPAAPVGWSDGDGPVAPFKWTVDDLAAEVSARFGPDWSLDASRSLDCYGGGRAAFRAYFSWDSNLLIVQAVADYGDGWDVREVCPCGGWDVECCEEWPYVGEVYHYRGPSWRILGADLVADGSMVPVVDRAGVDVLLGVVTPP